MHYLLLVKFVYDISYQCYSEYDLISAKSTRPSLKLTQRRIFNLFI